MNVLEFPRGRGRGRGPGLVLGLSGLGLAVMGLVALAVVATAYSVCKIEVDTGQEAVLVRREGLDLAPDMDLAPLPKDGKHYKGIQTGGPNNGVLTEGRYFYNPYYWSWELTKQFEVPEGKIGIRVALSGKELPAGQVLAEPGQKGILRGVLKPARYPYNPYAEAIELHEPVTVPAGYRGVVTLLAGSTPKKPNEFLVEPGERGVQQATLDPGTYFLNPYETRVSLVDCRSKRFNLAQEGAMDFLSSDGFPITLDGVIEFRVEPNKVADVFVKYNEDANGDEIDEEIIAKIITPESRSLCRIGGSKLTGGQFINGEDREKFQRDLVKQLTENCKKQGIEILAVAITTIQPPQDIATPVRAREVAKQKLAQYKQEKLQQDSEAKLKVQEVMAEQKKKLVEAEQEVVTKTTKSEQEQAVAKTLAEQKLKVAKTNLEASKDKASAITAKAQASADVIRFNNKAEVAGLAARVSAFGGDGSALARNILIGKVAPAYRSILSNTEGPLMDLFRDFTREGPAIRSRSPLASGGVPGSPTPSPTPIPPPTPTSPPAAGRGRETPRPLDGELPKNPFTRSTETRR
jgi:regulator of protease activity HflC (stomatin/prohibitin superfamily)